MSRFVLNASRILVPDQTIEIYSTNYKDHHQLAELRREYRDKHLVRRTGDAIQASAISADAPVLDWKCRSGEAVSEPRLVGALVLEAFLRFAFTKGTPSRRHDPVTIPGGKNLLADLPNGAKLPEWLQVRSRFTVETRSLRSQNNEWAPFLILDTRSTREIAAPVATLLDVGFDPIGRYVQVLTPSDDPRLASRLELVGRAASIKSGVIQLTDVKGELHEVRADQAFIEPRDEIFEEVLQLILGSSAIKTISALESALAKGRQADAKLARLREVLRKLAPTGKGFEIGHNLSVSFEDFLAQGSEFFPAVDLAPPTKYVFDVGKSKVDEINRRGIEAHGPYNWTNFTPSSPRIAIVCESSVKGTVETFLKKFRDGIALPNVKFNPYGNGFSSLFRLRDVTLQIFETTDSSPTEVKRICQEIADRGQAGSAFDLVMLQNSESGKKLGGNRNPYLVAKSTLLKAGIASQSFLIEKTKSRDYDLAYILADLALGAYAKLGGTPWLISADHAIEHEIILGVGSASLGEGRLGDRERIVGITSVFKGDGDYLLSNLTKAVPFKEYAQALTSSLRICIDQVSKDLNWRSGDGVRIVVHAFKPMSNSEVDAVESVVSGLTDYRVQFAFLHVKESHPFSLFDESEPGILDRLSGVSRGKLCPRKGTFLRLSRDQTLACPWGAREVRTAEHGYPKPLLLELHRRSTFTDLVYLTRQVLSFASHSWRSFGPARMPVTILYSELVADLLGKLREVDGWSADVLPSGFGKRRWFL